MLAQAGLALQRAYGGYSFEEWSLESPRTIALARAP